MPEGFALSVEENAKFIDVIKDMNLTNEQASAIVKYGGEYAERIANQVYALQAQEITAWGEETKKALGADLQKNIGLCDTACRKLEAKYPGIGIREALFLLALQLLSRWEQQPLVDYYLQQVDYCYRLAV